MINVKPAKFFHLFFTKKKKKDYLKKIVQKIVPTAVIKRDQRHPVMEEHQKLLACK